MSIGDVIFVAVVVLFGVPGVQMFRAVRYRPSSPLERPALTHTTLAHYTSHATAAVLDQGDGTVHLRPRGGFEGRLAELMHRNPAGFLRRDRGAVYFYGSPPPVNVMRFHGHSVEALVQVQGEHLTPDRLFCSPHDTAVAVRGGYRGTGTITPSNLPPIPPHSARKKVAALVRVLLHMR